MLSKIWSFIIRYLGQGLLLTAPIGVTVYSVYWLFTKANLLADKFIKFDMPGLGLLIVIACIILIGIVGNLLIKLPVFNFFSRLIARAPLISIIYSSVKDLLSAFVGNKKKFTEPVLIRHSNDTQVEQMGFITQRDLSLFGISKRKISVYIPFPYSFMGNLYIVPEENVTLLDISPTQAMKFIVSGGVSMNETDNEEDEEIDSK